MTKQLPDGRELYRGLNLEIEAGECVAIMGESGVGKSTLLNIVAGLEPHQGGSIELDGVALDRLDDRSRTEVRRKHFGFVFQAFHILPHLTLKQNVALALLLNEVPRRLAEERALEALGDVGLADRQANYPRQISGGELQRVAIARALVHRPKLLLADEPTGNLDPSNAARVLGLMSRLMREANTATLLVTHSDATASIADRRLRLTESGFQE